MKCFTCGAELAPLNKGCFCPACELALRQFTENLGQVLDLLRARKAGAQ